MAGILNNCARPITLNCRLKRGGLVKHRLNPMDFKTIPDGEWNLLKKNPVVQGYLDKGDLVVGKKAPIQVPEDFEQENDNLENEENGEDSENGSGENPEENSGNK